jgi:aspartyl protease family protein
MKTNEIASLILSMGMLLYIGLAVFGNPRTDGLQKVKHLLIWLFVFFVITTGYVFRDSFDSIKERYKLNILPGYHKKEGNVITLKMADDGHFYVNLLVNKKKLRFLIDTGATRVVINQPDAQEIGLNSLVFAFSSNTANGEVKMAKANVDIQLDDVLFEDFTVYVNSGDLDVSLLGMSFLTRLDSFEIDGQYLYLKLPNL